MYDEFKLQGQLKAAKEEGRGETFFEVARNLLNIGMDIEQICTVTGLSAEQVEGLKK